MKWIVEKIPLFVLSGIMTYVTFAIQAKRAVASVEMHNIAERISYAGFGWVWYLLKAVVPIPMSALHPYPSTPGALYYLCTVLAVVVTVYALWKIRNRHFLFGFGFYTVNLILVLQLISIGNAVVAERYTYMPYIGIFFWAAMELYGRMQGKWAKFKKPILGCLAVWILFLGFLTVQRIPVWKNSQTLWADVLETYPDAKRAWTNKGLDFYDQRKWPEVVDHLTRALAIDSLYPDALEWRGKAYLELKDAPNALRDASLFYRIQPHKESSQFLMARAFEANGQVDQALDLYNKLIDAHPKPEYYNNRGVILFNRLQRFAQAKTDFEEAIRLSPRNGSYYLNLSRCHYMLSDLEQARALAVKARELGHEVDEGYGKLIGM
jgi:tetratricopeptide (TPR) repeat protein